MGSTLETQPRLDDNTQEFLQQAAAAKFDFHTISVKAAGDEKLKRSINNAVLRQHTGRQLCLTELPDADKLRTLAGEIKQHAIENLDYYLEQLARSEEHTSELQSPCNLVCRLLLEKKKLTILNRLLDYTRHSPTTDYSTI